MAVTRLISSHTHILYLSNLRWASYLLGDGEVVVLIFSLWPYRTPWHNALPNVSIQWIFAELICKIIGIHIPGLSHREPFPLLNIHNPCPQILGVVMHSEMKQLEDSAKRFSFYGILGIDFCPTQKSIPSEFTVHVNALIEKQTSSRTGWIMLGLSHAQISEYLLQDISLVS